MGSFSFALISLFLAFSQARSSVRSNLAAEARDSIHQYFFTSGRQVKVVKLETFNKISTVGVDYLVEAEVYAESYVVGSYIEYHCGVFIKKDNSRWKAQQTVCESITGVTF